MITVFPVPLVPPFGAYAVDGKVAVRSGLHIWIVSSAEAKNAAQVVENGGWNMVPTFLFKRDRWIQV